GSPAVVTVCVRDDHVADRLSARRLADLVHERLAGGRVAARVDRDDLVADQEPAGVRSGFGGRHPDAFGNLLDVADFLGPRRGGEDQEETRDQSSAGTSHFSEPLSSFFVLKSGSTPVETAAFRVPGPEPPARTGQRSAARPGPAAGSRDATARRGAKAPASRTPR